MNHCEDILFEQQNTVGIILINRPNALNALNMNMIALLSNQLAKWAIDPSIQAVIIKGEGDRAFCAGGDIRAIYQQRHTNLEAARQFFWAEYSMNAQIYHFPKPYIAFLDGITMGGGAGLSMHGQFRVATERLVFAMPETGIGFFPDIGAGYFLTRCPNKLGWYLGLTGNSIKTGDAAQLGLTTHTVTHDNLSALQDALIAAKLTQQNASSMVNDILQQFSASISDTHLWEHRDVIQQCFAKNHLNQILQALSNSDNPICQQAATTLATRSPTALHVTFQHLNRSATMDFDSVIKNDYDIAQHFLHSHDFFEGVRAAVIDKDRQPRWQPATLDAIDADNIAAYFKPMGERLPI